MSASCFLRYHAQVNIEFLFDVSHGVWRDQEAAVKDLQLTSWVHIMVITFNLLHSPWNSAAKYLALREAFSEFLDHLTDSCPLLDSMLSELAQDFGMPDMMHEQDLAHQVIGRMRTAWGAHVKGAQVKMCRFANWVDRAEEFDASWSLSWLRVQVYGLQEGHFNFTNRQALLAKSSGPSGEAEAGERVDTSRSNDPVNQFRSACKSNISVAGLVLCQPNARSTMRALYGLVKPIRV